MPVSTINNSGVNPYTLNYTITPTANGCSGATGVYSITVNPSPTTAFSSANQSICTGQNTVAVNLNSSTPGVTFSWNVQGAIPPGLVNFNPITGTSTIPVYTNLTNNTSAPITVTIVAQATTSGPAQCPGTNATYTITIKPSPIATSNFVSNDTVCSGQNIQLNLSSTTAATNFTWTANNGAGVSGGQNSVAPSLSINQGLTNNSPMVGNVTYTITPTSANCPGPPITVLAYVNPVATVGPFNPIVVCPGTTITPPNFVSVPAGSVFAWSNTNASIGIGLSSTGQLSPWTAPSNTNNNTPGTITGTVTVTPTFNGCPGTPSSFAVTINPTPTITNNSLSQTICSGTPTTNVSWTPSSAGTTFNWTGTSSSPNITGFTASGSSDLPPMTITNSGNTIGTVSYVVTPVRNGCSGTAVTYTITVNPTPILTLSANQTLCGGVATSISSFTNSVAGGNFTYSLNSPGSVPGTVT
ncbi:MAG: hypothetical protein EBS09_12080, partial [Flavobacteriia bacterium]|nr:hypothetical protein [Flavobacteriia bacterium]